MNDECADARTDCSDVLAEVYLLLDHECQEEHAPEDLKERLRAKIRESYLQAEKGERTTGDEATVEVRED